MSVYCYFVLCGGMASVPLTRMLSSFTAFQTAVAIAQYRAIQGRDEGSGNEEDGSALEQGFTLDQSDFEEVCEMTREFKQYLTKANKGQDQETRAFNERARNDLDEDF